MFIGLSFCVYVPSYLADAVYLFSSEDSLTRYIRSKEYDADSASLWGNSNGRESSHLRANVPWGEVKTSDELGKVGMAVIFKEAPQEDGIGAWDYTLRFNYTYGLSMIDDQVSVVDD